MAVKTLKTLVLRKVNVLKGGLTVVTPRGLGYRGSVPPAPITMRVSVEPVAEPNPLAPADQEQDLFQAANAQRAGRSASSTGSSLHHSRAAARAICWPWFPGGSASMRGSEVRRLRGLATGG